MTRSDLVEYYVDVLSGLGYKTEKGIYTIGAVKQRAINELLTIVIGETNITINAGTSNDKTNIQIWGYVRGNYSDKEAMIDNVISKMRENLFIYDENNHTIGKIESIVVITDDVDHAIEEEEYYVFQINCILNVYEANTGR